MNKREKVSFVISKLEELFPIVPIPLNFSNEFTFLVAVLLSAQCTDERVNKVTPELFRLANNPYDMAKVSTDSILKIIKPCGLGPAKSKAIRGLSEILVNEYSGKVPNTFEALERLPGVGHKTASVVMSQTFGFPTFPVDTHIHRLINRWGLSNGKNVTETERDCKKVFPKHLWNKLHLQIIYFGRQYCQAKKHIVSECPICCVFEKSKL